MKLWMGAAALVAAMGFVVPAQAGQYEDCCSTCRAARARNLGNCADKTGNLLAQCKTRWEHVASICLSRCASAEAMRVQRAQHRARQAAMRNQGRAARDQSN